MYKDLISNLRQSGFSGQMVVAKEDQILLNFASGAADRSQRRSVDDQTLFAIASGTKFITALAVAKLVEESKGKITFDTPASEIIDLKIPRYDRRMTLGQLMSHTSGIPDYLDEDLEDENGEIQLKLPNCVLWRPEDYLPLFPMAEMDFEPGTQFKYNNGAYVYLALIIEKLSGLTYAHFINNVLLRPIGVNRAGVYAITALPLNTAFGYYRDKIGGGQAPETIQTNASIKISEFVQISESFQTSTVGDEEGYIWNVFKVPPQAGGDGGIYMTPFDMLRVWETFFKGEIVSHDYVKQMTTPVKCVDEEDGTYYGLGLWLKWDGQNSYQPFIMGSDVGVDFMSSYDSKQKLFKYAVSNMGHNVWRL